jgi:hypothetical protein
VLDQSLGSLHGVRNKAAASRDRSRISPGRVAFWRNSFERHQPSGLVQIHVRSLLTNPLMGWDSARHSISR